MSTTKKKEKPPRAAEVRAAKMEAAWRSHVGKLTLAQMSSPTACLEHLRRYGEAQGWPERLAIGEGEIPDIVSDYLHSRIAPSADAMAALVTMEQQFALNRALEEVLVQMRIAAEQGVPRTAWIELNKCKAFRPCARAPRDMDTHTHTHTREDAPSAPRRAEIINRAPHHATADYAARRWPSRVCTCVCTCACLCACLRSCCAGGWLAHPPATSS